MLFMTPGVLIQTRANQMREMRIGRKRGETSEREKKRRDGISDLSVGRQNFKKEQASFCQAFIVGTTLFKSFT